MDAVEGEELEEMRRRISQHPDYHRLENILTDEYLALVMTQLKKGKVRTFEYSCTKLENSIDKLSAYDFLASLSQVPESLLRNPFFYVAGLDNDGRYILVYEWARLKPSDWQSSIRHLMPLWTALFLAVIQHSNAPQVVVVSIGHNLNLPLRLLPTALRHLRLFIRASLEAFPDRVFQQFQFPGKAVIPVLQFVRRFTPPNTTRKLVVGPHSEVREKLAMLCDDFEDILPPELGGNENRVEQHVEFILHEDGSFESRILAPEESRGHVVLNSCDLEKKLAVEQVEEEKEELPTLHVETKVEVEVQGEEEEEKPRGENHWLFNLFGGNGKVEETETETEKEEEEVETKSLESEHIAEEKSEREGKPRDVGPDTDDDSEFEELESIVGSFRVQGKLHASDVLNDSLTLEARRVVYEAGKKKKRKRILKSVDARFVSNELTGRTHFIFICALIYGLKTVTSLAIMGPSGAGKSSLLNVLTGSKKLGQGEVLLNGIPITKSIRGSFAFIPQENVLFPGLTPRQAIHYAARLLQPDWQTKEERDKHVDALLERLQLLNCADSIVGGAGLRGISGGERKRTSIALDLISCPRILFVDEPTSGMLSTIMSHRSPNS